MFPEQLRKILNLVKRTGDRVVVFDGNAPDDSYVIMGFDTYAAGLGVASLTPEFKAPVTPAAKIPFVPLNIPIIEELSDDLGEIENLTEEDLTDKINREISMWKNRENSAYLGEENKPKKAWDIPSKVKDKAQEVE
jgi:hypothetical protein